MQKITLFIITLIFTILLDMVWLFCAKSLYIQNIGDLFHKVNGVLSPNLTAGFIVYLLLVAGIIFFVVPKAHGNYLLALGFGMFFGGIIYGVYDFTNFATLANWPLQITIIDTLWGMVLCGLSSVFSNWVIMHLDH